MLLGRHMRKRTASRYRAESANDDCACPLVCDDVIAWCGDVSRCVSASDVMHGWCAVRCWYDDDDVDDDDAPSIIIIIGAGASMSRSSTTRSTGILLLRQLM